VVEETKRYSLNTVGISSPNRRVFNTVELENEWKVFHSGVKPTVYPTGGRILSGSIGEENVTTATKFSLAVKTVKVRI